MNKKIKTVILILIAIVLWPGTMAVQAGFEDTGAGARQLGMGGAFSALADDVNAVFYNPAGLDRIKWIEVSMFTSRLYEGLSDESALGSSFIGLNVPLELAGNVGAGWFNFNLSEYYSENTYIVSYARKLKDPLNAGFLSAGINFKMFSRNFNSTPYTEQAVNLDTGYASGGVDPVFENGYASSAIAFDAGMLYSPLYSPEHNFAVVLRNLNSPDMGLKDVDRVSRQLKLGYAYTARHFNAAVDVSFERGGTFMAVGLEKAFGGGAYALRAGMKAGGSGYMNFSFGTMYRYNDMFQFDYGFSLPLQGVASAFGSHRLSVIMRFGGNMPVFVDSAAKLRAMERKVESAMDRVENVESSENLPEVNEILYKAKENAERVREEINISKEKQKEMIESYYREGLAEYSSGNLDKAIKYWEYAIRLDPNNSKVKNALEQARREQGR